MKDGWKIKPFSDICYSIEDGDWIEKKDQSDSGIRLVQTGNVGVGQYRDKADKSKFISEETFKRLRCTEIVAGDVLISRLPDPVGRACILPQLETKCITAVDCSILKLKTKEIDPSWFIYYTQSDTYFSSVRAECSGTTRDRISRKKLSGLTIPVPSLSEQQRIVDILDAEFEKIERLRSNAELSLRHAKDLFQAALKKELEPSEGWKKKSIGDVCSIYGRIGFRGYTKADLVNNPKDGAISLSPSNIIDNKMNYEKCSYISWYKYEESPEIKIYENDILLVKTGSSYGKSAIIEGLPHEATINPQFVVLKDITINRRFLWFFLRTPYAQSCFDRFVSGTAIPTFSQRNLGMMIINIPSEPVQNQIVATLDELDAKCKVLQDNYTKTIALCDDLKQALLRKAFNGEL